ncbi:hypothetical protein Nepgr_004284 [Nepenthes gracilis]|uniref:Uncharacterized protein n=1 Tax=Nepenthes gracilis TaxID=150966 RepID=A0AAD3XF12_NEPGR|nr:hypothetical protein Nepgr_004284 [Nepenthes gracilis]
MSSPPSYQDTNMTIQDHRKSSDGVNITTESSFQDKIAAPREENPDNWDRRRRRTEVNERPAGLPAAEVRQWTSAGRTAAEKWTGRATEKRGRRAAD